MINSDYPPERAFIRLGQLAREEKDAVLRQDKHELCRVAMLLQSTMHAMEGYVLPASPDCRRQVDEILEAHSMAQEFLNAEMGIIRSSLKARVNGRKSLRAYSGRTRI